jgi:hypothetical protein
MPAAQKSPLKDPLVRAAVRNHLTQGLVDRGYTRGEAQEALKGLNDAAIDQVVQETAGGEQGEAGASVGSLIRRVLDFVRSEQFRRVVEELLPLFTPADGGPEKAG